MLRNSHQTGVQADEVMDDFEVVLGGCSDLLEQTLTNGVFGVFAINCD